MRVAACLLFCALPALARADIAEECQGLPMPDDYDEQQQQDFLQNFPALSLTFSPTHGPVPHEPGHGMVGVQLAGIPPLSCRRRYVLGWSKTEDTNKTPLAPKLHASFAGPEVLGVLPWVGVAYLPPVTLLGTRNVVLSVEAGLGYDLDDSPLQLGLRFHATSVKIVADIATAFDERRDPSVDDLYIGSTFGADLMAGWELSWATPYVAAGVTDASTFFYIGDDGVVTNNLHPYAGPTFALGLDGLLFDRLRWGAEFYAAPGGYSRPDPGAATVSGSYGHLYTGRLRLGYEL